MSGAITQPSCLWWSDAFSNGFWVFVGIIAGTLVTLLSAYVLIRLKRRKIKQNIKFEVTFNISKIQEWKGMLEKLLEHSNSDNIEDCLVLFDFEKIIFWTVHKTISDGTVYDYIDQESIVTVQKLADFCTPFYSTNLNQAIQEFKTNPDKAGVAKLVRFWKTTLDQHETALRLFESKL
ncbi:MAG: hypothetical protein KDD53_12945 [Bdellovibrionales bacterium]|nr:hypothetical protein [Bdellovibrionales bacterium]